MARSLMTPTEATPADQVITWAMEAFPTLTMTTGLNLAGTVLIDIAYNAGYRGSLAFVDTGYHFPQTEATWAKLHDRYAEIDLITLSAENAYDTLYESDPTSCCAINKVAPLTNYLSELAPQALLNARTRESAPTRGELTLIEQGTPLRINPLLNWTRGELEAYAKSHRLLVNPLYYEGFLSIGCWPCTKAVRDGEDPRSGRFVGQGRTECGIWTQPKTLNLSNSNSNSSKVSS